MEQRKNRKLTSEKNMARAEFSKIQKTKEFHVGDIAILSATSYRNKQLNIPADSRKSSALKTFARYVSMGNRVYVSDFNSDPDFLERLKIINKKKLIKIIHADGKSFGSDIRAALRTAHKAGENLFMWTEPEKFGIADIRLLAALVDRFNKKRCNILIPRRKSLISYPRFQAKIEKKANEFVTEELFGKAHLQKHGYYDFWFGVRMFDRVVAPYFLNYEKSSIRHQPDKWDGLQIPIIRALRRGTHVESLDVDFTYPAEQKNEEKKHSEQFLKKRHEQFRNVTRALLGELGKL